MAGRAGVTAGLVHYYFPSLDDLFIALLRESTDRFLAVDELHKSSQPLRAIWDYASDKAGNALLMEFLDRVEPQPGAAGKRRRKVG